MTLTSVLKFSTSWTYQRGKVSLSPPVKSMELGSQAANKFLAESTVRYLFDLSWSSQFSMARIDGDENDINPESINAIFLLLISFPKKEKIEIIPNPIQIEKA